MKSVKDIILFNKKVIIRVDFNVPLNNGTILSTKRIDETLPTLNYILEQNPKQLIILSHLGRPKGKYVKDLSLQIILPYLKNRLNRLIDFCTLDSISNNNIILLENIRFYPEETDKNNVNTHTFRKKLSDLGEVFINDAFACYHRNHSSIVGIDTSEKGYGLLVERELNYLENTFNTFDGIKIAMIGGSKIRDKIQLLENIIPKINYLVIGGGMAFTFMKNLYKMEIGNSLYEPNCENIVTNIVNMAKKHNVNIILPKDFICCRNIDNVSDIMVCDASNGIPNNWIGLDIGVKSIIYISSILKKAELVIWNGPFGLYEIDRFAKGTYSLLHEISSLTNDNNLLSIICGGDTATCCENINLEKSMSHISTGGGSCLELLEGKILPGIQHLHI